MKKITFNAPLNHKAYSYEPMQIEVEKVITLYGKRFEQMRDHPLEDNPEIIDNRELMYMEGKLSAIEMYLGQKDTTLAAELDKFVEQTYTKVVPQNVRDFIDMMADKKPERRSGRKAKPTEQFQSEQHTED